MENTRELLMKIEEEIETCARLDNEFERIPYGPETIMMRLCAAHEALSKVLRSKER